MISIHAPLTGSDDFLFFHIYLLLFQSTLPSQGATKSTSSYTAKILISIHAPLTGSDFLVVLIPLTLGNFNPRSPHRERLDSFGASQTGKRISIHAPLTGSDYSLIKKYNVLGNFNPRSPHRERPIVVSVSSSLFSISIHAPLTGSDCVRLGQCGIY